MPRPFLPLLTLLTFCLLASPISAETLILKDGTRFEGEVVFQDENQVRFRVQNTVKSSEVSEFGGEQMAEVDVEGGMLTIQEGSARIRETKIFKMEEVERIDTPSPDKVYYETLKKLVPTPSLLERSAYEERLRLGPNKFLADFPDSIYKRDVEAIKKEMEEELEKIRNGWIKLSSEWISPEDQETFEDTVDARVLAWQMRQHAEDQSWLPALRSYEKLEEVYGGSPAHVDAIPTMAKIIQSYGTELQQEASAAQFQSNQRQASLRNMQGEQLAQFQEVLKQENQRFTETLDREKKADLKWRSTNPLDLDTFRDALKVASEELKRVREIDVDALEDVGRKVMVAEQLISTGNIGAAELRLKELQANDVITITERLQERLAKQQEVAARKADLAARSESEAARAVINMPGEGQQEGADAMNSDEQLDALFATRESPEEKEKEEDGKPKRPEKSSGDDAEKAAEREALLASLEGGPSPSAGGGGGFNPVLILIPVVLLMATGVIFFISKKKKKGGDEMEEVATEEVVDGAEEPASAAPEDYDDMPLR